jgi:hypothetical protein
MIRVGEQLAQELKEVATRYDQDEAEIARTALVIGLAVLGSAVSGRVADRVLDVLGSPRDAPTE